MRSRAMRGLVLFFLVFLLGMPSVPWANTLTTNPEGVEKTASNGIHGRAFSSDSIRQEIVFVDASLPDYRVLTKEIRSGRTEDVSTHIFVLDSDEDGLAQIGRTLRRFNGLDAVHLLSHGRPGAVILGKTEVGLREISEESIGNEIRSWGEHLNPGADFLFYGCKVGLGEKGNAFLKAFANLTGTDVAGSVDDTGHADLGGDWALEWALGEIGSRIVIPENSRENWYGLANVASGYTEYFIPGELSDLRAMFAAIDSSPSISNEMVSIVSIVPSTDGTTVFYDHWEDGYEDFGLDPATFDASTELFVGLSRGDAQILETASVEANPRDPGVFAYDGQDRVFVIGGPAAVSYATWPVFVGTEPGSVFSLAWEVYPVKPFLNEYTVPVGEDLAPEFDDFDQVYVFVQATADNTNVSIGATNITLNKGESYRYPEASISANDPLAGMVVSSDQPIQVQLAVGQQQADLPSELRGFTLVPNNLWDSEYYAPVKSANGSGGKTDIFIYNPNSNSITIEYEDKLGSGSFSVPEGMTSYSEIIAATSPSRPDSWVPEDSAVYLRSVGGEKFWGISSVGTENDFYDWGYALVPAYALTEEYFMGWSVGSLNSTNSGTVNGENGSPIYVTPVQDNTVVFVDFDNDGVNDQVDLNGDGAINGALEENSNKGIFADRLDSITLFDPDGDQRGTVITTTGPVALAWGEDADVASAAFPNVDLGYTPLPLPAEWMDLVVLDTEKISDVDFIEPVPGREVVFTLNVPAYNILSGLDVRDILPLGWDFQADSATIQIFDASAGAFTVYATGSAANPSISIDDPAANQDTLFWDLELFNIGSPELGAMQVGSVPTAASLPANLNPNDYVQIQYTAVITADTEPGYNKNTMEAIGTSVVADLFGEYTYTSRDDKYVLVSPLSIDKNAMLPSEATVPDDDPNTPDVFPGEKIKYTIDLQNITDPADTDVVTALNVQDLLPPDFSYVPDSTVLTVTDNGTTGNTNLSSGAITDDAAGNITTATVDGRQQVNFGNGNWEIGPGDIVSIAFEVLIDSEASPGIYDNTAVATATLNTSSFVVTDEGTQAEDAGTPTNLDPEGDEDVKVRTGYSISGSVFDDNTGTTDDGLDVGDSPIESVTVQLFTDPNADGNPSDGVQVGTDVSTAADGSYSFQNLINGNYVVVETDPTGYASVTDIDGDTTDPDFNRIAVTLADADVAGNDFLDQGNLQISGSVFLDNPQDGLLDGNNETPIQNVTVQLFTDPNADGDPADGVQLGTDALTAADGTYLFSNLSPGNYVVVETDPTGYASVTDIDGDTTDPAFNQIPVLLTTLDVTGRYFLDRGNLSISGNVSADTTNDDNGDTPIEGISVTLFVDADGDGVADAPGTPVGTILTDIDGNYSFGELPPGTYLVVETDGTAYPDDVSDSDGTGNGTDSDSIIVDLTGGVDSTGNNFVDENQLNIFGNVSADTDNDDVGDLNLTGIQIELFLDANDDGTPDSPTPVDTTTTNASGNYSFLDVTPGRYVVVETNNATYPDNVSDTDGAANGTNLDTIKVNLTNADSTGNDFVDEDSLSIIGTVLADTDNDDAGDTPIDGITVELFPDADDNGVPDGAVPVATTTTGATGGYSFADVTPGLYVVVETDGPDYPDDVSDIDGDANGTDLDTIKVDVSGGIDSAGNDFVDENRRTIAGTVQADTDNDDAGDAPIAGITVELFADADNNGVPDSATPVATTTTNATGDYSFADVTPGLYVVVETDGAAYPDDVSDIDGDGNGTDLDTIKVDVSLGDSLGNDFVDEDSLSISGTVLADTDNDDAGDTPIDGITVELFPDADDNGVPDGAVPVATTTTGATGGYSFADVTPGLYVVVETDGPDYPDDVSDIDGNGNGTDLDTIKVDVSGGIDSAGNDFVDENQLNISGNVSADTNNDDLGDLNLGGISVALFLDADGDGSPDSPGSPLETTVTDADGNYFFTDVSPGNYLVVETDGTEYPDDVNDRDGTANGTDLDSIAVGLTGGVDSTGNDFVDGNRVIVSGNVALDADADGDPADPDDGISGVAVALFTDPNGDGNPADGVQVGSNAVTDANGDYRFEDVAPNQNYVVVETNPAGYLSTFDLDGDVGNTLDQIGFSVAGVDVSGLDFLDTDLVASIGDLVWGDVDGNGVINGTESGIDGVTLDLYADANGNGAIDAGETVLDTQTTAGGGLYDFAGLPAGDYIVDVTDTAGVLTGLNQTGGTDPRAATVVAGQDFNEADFGYQPTGATLGDRIWEDANGDGVQDAGEPGIDGVTVDLYTDANGNGAIDAGETVLATQTTTGGGFYDFTGLPAGDYIVDVTDSGGVLTSFNLTGGTDPLAVTLPASEDFNDADFGYQAVPPSGAIGDRVYIDLNGNGVDDPGEPGIPNVTVRLLDEAGAEIDAILTDADGRYRFPGLPEGTYTADVVDGTVPAGLATADDPSPPIALGPGEIFLDADFGYVPETGIIGDTVWRDVNGDGVQNPGESGIGGVTVALTAAGPDGLLDTADDVSAGTATTAADGSYAFSGLDAGRYRMDVTDTAGVLVNATLTGGTDPTAPIDLAAGQAFLNADFGYQIPDLSTLTDRLWRDDNANGAQDGGEPGFAGVTVSLLDSAGTVIATDISDAAGDVQFPGLPDGDYTLVVTDTAGILDGFVDTTPAATVGFLDATVSGADVSGTSFGYNRPGAVGDTVFSDADGDGLQGPGEPGIAGVTLALVDPGADDVPGTPDDTVLATAETGPDGGYLFPGLTPGRYAVVVTDDGNALEGFALTSGNAPFGPFDLAAGASRLDADFGYQRIDLPDISGIVWNDLDAGAVREGGEPFFPEVTVQLLDDQGLVVAETTTDPDGNFRFRDLPPGDYTVVVTDRGSVLEGYGPTTPATEYPVTVSDADITGLDFGYVRSQGPGSIGDRVWTDRDGDGVQDSDEPGLPGVVLFLDLNGDGQPNAGESVQETGPGGSYRFPDLVSGDYTVGVDPASIPAGYLITGGTDPFPLFLPPGVDFNDADFGFQPRTGALGDRVWLDADGDGVQGPGETGVTGVVVRLLAGGTDTVLAETTTDGTGAYRFDGLAPVSYQVEVVPPEGFNLTTPDAGSGLLADDFDSDFSAADGRSPAIFLEIGEENTSVDAGLIPVAGEPGAIGDRVWYDTDSDGVQDADEPGLSGVTIRLLDPDTAVVLAETVSDGSGGFGFQGLPAGDYVLEFVPPNGAVFSPAGAGDDPAADSDADPATGRTGTIAVLPGEAITSVDAGLSRPQTPPASLGDRVWRDDDGDGIQADGEPGLSDVLVMLADAAGAELARTTTGADGAYRFEGLAPGDYRLRFELPGGFAFSPAGEGTDPALDSDPAADTGEISVTLAAGENRDDLDAGLIPAATPFTIGDLVWVDGDADGLPDPGEGQGGVRLTLQRPDGEVVAETITGPDGTYAFPDLPPGDYRVLVDRNTLPADVDPLSDPDGGLDNLADVVNLSADRLDVDFGYGPPVPPEPTPPPADLTARLGDRVWEDLNGDGIQNDGEPGLPGVTVRLLNAAGTVTLAETVTDDNGRYVFFGLTPGSYQVEFIRPSGYAFSPQGQTVLGRDSNPDPETGLANVSLSPGAAVLDVDAGLVPTQRIVLGDLVWADANGNGLPDADEGLGGVRLVLTDGTGAVIAETVTAAAGGYRFTDLPPGDYGVRVDSATLPEGLEPFVDPEGPADGAALLPNQDADNLDVDFGFRPAGPGPDLTGVVKVAVDLDGGELLPGDEIAYAVTLRNEGAGAAREVVYVDTPDPFSRLVPGSVVTERGAVTLGNGSEDFSIRVEIGTLESGESVRVSYRVTVAADAAPGSWIVNQGMLMASGQSVEPTEWPVSAPLNDPTVIGPIPGGTPAPATAFVKSATDLNGAPLRPGDGVEYAFTVRNDGTETATGLMLFDGPPTGTSLVPGSAYGDRGTVVEGNPIEWMVGDLGPGEVFQGRFQVTVNADISEGALICNRAVLLGDGGLWLESLGPDGDETCLPVSPADGAMPVVRAVKRVTDLDGGNLAPGDRVGYRVTLVNPADVPAEGVVFSDPMNGRAALIAGSVTASRGAVELGNALADTEVRVSVGTMAPGERVEIALEARISPDAMDGEIIPNQGRVEWTGGAAPTDDPATATPDDPTDVVVVQPGGERVPPRGFKGVQGDWPLVSWTLRYENDDDRAMVLHVEDPMPEGARIVADSVTATFGTTGVLADPERVVWDGVVPAGGAVEIGYRVRVDDGVFRLDNQACAIWDRNGDGRWTDEPEAGTGWICTDDPATPAVGDPTVWTTGCELSLGDRVWIDTDADGLCRLAEERSPDGVRLSLYRDADGDNRYTPGVDPWIAATATETRDGVPGVYRFVDICPGDYIVGVDPSNFAPGGPLEGMRPTAFGGDPDNDRDGDSNGEDWGDLGVFSPAFTLTPNLEPLEEDGDAMSNLTVDFGFLPPPPSPEECPACGPFKPF